MAVANESVSEALASENLEMEAQKKQALPDSVQVNGGNAPVERGEYLKMVDSNKDLVKQYGEPNFEAFMNRVGLDSQFAQKVVTNLLSGAKGTNTGLHPDSPQENNLTGRIDRTVDTPTRIKFDGQSTAKPSSVA